MLVKEAAGAVSDRIVSWGRALGLDKMLDSPRIEPAHSVIALKAAVHDGGVSLLGNALLGDLGIDPFGKTPHVRADLAKLDRGRGIVLDGVLEGLVEVAVI